MEKLLNDYLTIINSSTLMKFIFNSLDEDISINDSDIFKYYYDFKSINLNKINECLINEYISRDKVDRIISILKYLKNSYDKYNINNLNEFALKILEYWENNKFYSDELIKSIILIEGGNKLVKSDISLLKIYKDMVDNDMIRNPNIVVGTSFERLYTMLPDDTSCYSQNLKIISNPIIDWSIYRNGRNPFEFYCFLYNNSKNEEERKYYHDLIITAIYSSCSLFNNKFICHNGANKSDEMINYYLLVEKNEINNGSYSIDGVRFINEISNLLLTDTLFNHQLELYTEKNNEADSIIKRLELSRERLQHKL